MDQAKADFGFALLKQEDISAITELEKQISSRLGEDTILLAYNKAGK